MSKDFRIVAIAHGTGFARYTVRFTLSTNETEMEKIWARARRETKKRMGSDVSVAIKSVEEIR